MKFFFNSNKNKFKKLNNNYKKFSTFFSMLFSIAIFVSFDFLKKKTSNKIIISDLKNLNYPIEKITIINNEEALFNIKNTYSYFRMTIPSGEYLEKKLENTNLKDIPTEYVKRFKMSKLIMPFSIILGLLLITGKRHDAISSMTDADPNKLLKTQDQISTRFSDVIGQENAIKLVGEYVDILKNSETYKKLGVKTPKGILFSGPPGTGKTLIARAVAGETNMPFLSMSGSEFNEMFVGVGAARVKKLFALARKASKMYGGCVLFIDEIDAIGQKRGMSSFSGNSERENTLNQILTELDGFEENENLLVFAATNRAELLDPALVRPGRFDRSISMELPDIEDRQKLFKFYLGKLQIDQELLENLANIGSKLTPGFSGAEISNICNESGIISVRHKHKKVTEQDMKDAIDFVMMGSEKKSLLSEEEKKIVSFHECGHAYLSCYLPNVNPPVKVSIIAREKGMLGFSQSLPESEYLHSKNQILEHIQVLMGGRICEEVFCNDITSGASNDIEKATQLAYNYVNRFCMGESNVFANVNEDSNSFTNSISEKTKAMIDTEVNELMKELYQKSKKIIVDNQDKIKAMREILVEKETIYYKDIEKIL